MVKGERFIKEGCYVWNMVKETIDYVPKHFSADEKKIVLGGYAIIKEVMDRCKNNLGENVDILLENYNEQIKALESIVDRAKKLKDLETRLSGLQNRECEDIYDQCLVYASGESEHIF